VTRELGVPVAAEWDEPEVGAGEAIVTVEVAGVNPVDVARAAGTGPRPVPTPHVAGMEGIGTVAGRRVYFDKPIAPHGSMAERTVIEPETAIDVPDELEAGLAVSFGVAGLAAWLGLDWRGGLRAGETVLVLGASGVVGQLGVQIARLLGAGRVVAAARDTTELGRLGADSIVALDGSADLRQRLQAASGKGFDIVLDLVWGEPAAAALGTLRGHGRLVQVGSAAAATATIDAAALRARLSSILSHAVFAPPQEVRVEAFQRMCRHGLAGELTVDVEEAPLTDVAAVWERQRRSPHAKLVIRP
jgi:NADPH:quinone reductase-like Zn-dependent oxidoreductase